MFAKANNAAQFDRNVRFERIAPAGYATVPSFSGFVRTTEQREADERRLDDAAHAAEEQRRHRQHARETARTRQWRLRDYEEDAAGEFLEWSANIGNKGAHFPARGLHVLIKELIYFCVDDEETAARLVAAYSTACVDEQVRVWVVVSCRSSC